MEHRDFKKRYPKLNEEIKSEVGKAELSFRTEPRRGSKKYRGYNPDMVDFIRRCSTPEEAEEIISYMEGRGEITRDEAEETRQQLETKGLRSFGEKKNPSFYENEK